MKLYLVKGAHAWTPGQPQLATFSPTHAAAFAAELVAIMRNDVLEQLDLDTGDLEPVDPTNWQAALMEVQARRFMSFQDISYEAARKMVEDDAGEAGQETGFDVWIEELDVEMTAPAIPPEIKERVEKLTHSIENALKSTAALLPGPGAVVVDMTGGCLQGAWSDRPGVEIAVLDFDPGDDWDRSDAVTVIAGNGHVNVAQGNAISAQHSPAYVRQIFGEIEARESPDDLEAVVQAAEASFVQPAPRACGQCEGTGTIEGGLSGDGPDEECPVCDGSGDLPEPGKDDGDNVHLVQPRKIAAGAAIRLLRTAVETWEEDMEGDEPITGSDAVEWLCGFYAQAKNIIAGRAPNAATED